MGSSAQASLTVVPLLPAVCVLPDVCVLPLSVCAQPLLVPPGAQGLFSECEEGAGGGGWGACRALTDLQAQGRPVGA